MANASIVISTPKGECVVRSTDTPDNPRVSVKFGDVTVFLGVDDAHELGADLIATAARASFETIVPPALVPAGHEDFPEEQE